MPPQRATHDITFGSSPDAQFVSHLRVAQIREQHGGRQQVDHHSRGQRPHPRLNPPGTFERVIDHLERHKAGQLTEMAGRERHGGYSNRTRFGNLVQQRSPCSEDVLE